MSAAPPPNWYPDPHDRAQLRWWDGTQWTEHRHPVVAVTPVVDDNRSVFATANESALEEIDDRTTVQAPVRASATGETIDQWAVPASEAAPVSDATGRTAPEPMTSWNPSRLPVKSLPQPQLPQPLPQLFSRAEPTPNRRPLFIGLGVLAVIVVAAVAFALTRGGDSDDLDASATTTVAVTSTAAPTTTGATTTAPVATTRPPTTTAVAPTTAAPPAGTTFSDSTNVYRLRVAPTWSDSTVIGGLQTWATGTGSTVFRDSVNVLIEKLPGDISMDDYLAASVRNAPKSLPSFAEVSRSVNTVNGKVLGQLDFRSNQNIPLRHRAVVLIKGRNAIVVTFTAEPDRFDAEASKLQPYLTSVEGV